MICIGFGTNERLASRLIRRATESDWSHTWLEFPSSVWGSKWVAHSGPGGITKIPLSIVEEAYPERSVYLIGIDVKRLHTGFRWARDHIGSDSGYNVAWNGFLFLLWRATVWERLYGTIRKNVARYTGSDFVAGFLKAGGVTGFEKSDPKQVTPGHLERFCNHSNDFQWLGYG